MVEQATVQLLRERGRRIHLSRRSGKISGFSCVGECVRHVVSFTRLNHSAEIVVIGHRRRDSKRRWYEIRWQVQTNRRLKNEAEVTVRTRKKETPQNTATPKLGKNRQESGRTFRQDTQRQERQIRIDCFRSPPRIARTFPCEARTSCAARA